MASISTLPITRYERTFTKSELAGGILTVTHNLGQKYVSVVVYDENDGMVMVKPMLLDTVSFTLDFSNDADWDGNRRVLVLS